MALRRGREWLLRDMDLRILPGRMLWLRGANGSGKTSLLRVLAGLSRPETGTVERAATAQTPVYIGHHTALKDDLTAHEALRFLACLHDRDHSAESVGAALRRLRVAHRSHHAVRTLSQGQRRRVALARLALEQSPGLWILDEPFDALDDEGLVIVLRLIGDHLQRGGAVILSSHLPFELPGVTVQTLDLDARAIHA